MEKYDDRFCKSKIFIYFPKLSICFALLQICKCKYLFSSIFLLQFYI